MSNKQRANGWYASGQVERAVLDALSPAEALDIQTIWQRVRSGPHAPDAPLKSVSTVLSRLVRRRQAQRTGSRGAYVYRRNITDSPMLPEYPPAPQQAPALTTAGPAPAAVQIGRYLLHPDAWRLIDRGVADQIAIYLTTEPRRLVLNRREEPDLYAQACAWADGLGAAPLDASERAALQACIDGLTLREAEALALAEQYAKELDEARRELEQLRTDPTKLLALLSSRLTSREG